MEIVRRATEAYNRRDVDGFLEYWSNDAVLDWSNSRGFDARVFRGHDEIRASHAAFPRDLRERSDRNSSMTRWRSTTDS